MKSATSFFNLHTVRKDITRFAPLWGIYLIGGILVMISNFSGNQPYYTAQGILETLASYSVINMLYAGAAATLLFGDLFQPRLCNALHAMPLRRETWFASHVLAGLAFSVIPNAIGITLLLPSLQGYGYIALLWLLGMTLEYLFFFGLAVFSVFCTGNRFAMVAVYAILNSASILAMMFITSIYEPLLFGMEISTEPFKLFCPIAQLCTFYNNDDFVIFGQLSPGDMARSDRLENYYTFEGFGTAWGYLGILTVLGVALLAMSLMLYRRRALETAGDFMAVRPLAPVFSLIYTLTIGILFSAVGDLMIGDFSVFLMVGIIVGYFTGQMLLQRTVKVFKPKAFLKCGGILVLLLVSMGLTWLDPIGITRYVPAPEKIEKVELEIAYNGDYMVLTSEKDIQAITNAHQQIVDAGRDSESGSSVYTEIIYTLENNQKIIRTYKVKKDTQAYEALRNFLSRPDLVLGYTDWKDYVNRILRIELEPTGTGLLSPSLHAELMEAIKADCEAGNLIQSENFYSASDKSYAEYKGWITIISETDQGLEYYQNLRFYNRSENIIAFLEKYNSNK